VHELAARFEEVFARGMRAPSRVRLPAFLADDEPAAGTPTPLAGPRCPPPATCSPARKTRSTASSPEDAPMSMINYASREINCKIVYYGPGLGGKTTNLEHVYEKVSPSTRGKLISLATETERTLFFDFLPVDLGTIRGFRTRFHLYTVPGQVYYNASRKLILRGVDGVVFVADSQADRAEANVEAMQNLYDNLSEHGYDLTKLPFVIQYNKRDLPDAAPVAELDAMLNPGGRCRPGAPAPRREPVPARRAARRAAPDRGVVGAGARVRRGGGERRRRLRHAQGGLEARGARDRLTRPARRPAAARVNLGAPHPPPSPSA
jgi:signal recognition particle receptor subunit beta